MNRMKMILACLLVLGCNKYYKCTDQEKLDRRAWELECIAHTDNGPRYCRVWSYDLFCQEVPQ